METLERYEESGRPDRNEPDMRVEEDTICLIYGFKETGRLSKLNGRECYVFGKAYLMVDGFKSLWFECHIPSLKISIELPHECLMVLDEDDGIIISAIR